jgi:hypothetical protein
MKELDVRLKAIEDIVYADSAVPSQGALAGEFEVLSESVLDALRAIIVSLRQVRQQGAYTYANQLAAKYFPDEDVEHIGDVFTTSSLERAGGN